MFLLLRGCEALRLKRWLLSAIVIFIFSVTSISVIREIRKIVLFNERASLLKQKIAEIEAENEVLREKIRLAKSGFLLEKILREEFKMSRPGEVVIYFKEGGKENGTEVREKKR